MLIARGRLKHQYPHSWRSKKPVIFRNTPQWFIAMDKPIAGDGKARPGDTLRDRALEAIKIPAGCRRRARTASTAWSMSKPDWVISRQRAWGVPITVFVREKGDGSVEILDDERVNKRIADAFEAGGRRRLVRRRARASASSAHACQRGMAEGRRHPRRLVRLRLDARLRAGRRRSISRASPASGARRTAAPTPSCISKAPTSTAAGSSPRCWKAAARAACAPFDVVLTHGFVLDEHGRKMSKSLGNVVAPQDVIKQSGADILRLWVCASDYADDLRIGPGNPQDHGRDLSQAAQHAALDAGLARAFPRGRPRRARRRCRSSSG